jgi:hypothetical protein
MFSETLEVVLNLVKTMQLSFHDEFSSGVAILQQKYASTIQQIFLYLIVTKLYV